MPTTNTNNEIRELRQEVKDLTALIEKTAKKVASNGSAEVFGLNRSDLQDMARKAGRNARHFIDEKYEQMHHLRDNAEERITSHPFTSIAAAIAGGMIIGAILNRK